MTQAAQAGAWQYVDGGVATTTTVHVDDAARLYLLAAQKGRSGECYNATWETNVTQRELAEAFTTALGIPLRGISFQDFAAKAGPFFARFLTLENRASNAKAKKELGWDIRAEKGILEEISSGSYVEVAKNLRNPIA